MFVFVLGRVNVCCFVEVYVPEHLALYSLALSCRAEIRRWVLETNHGEDSYLHY